MVKIIFSIARYRLFYVNTSDLRASIRLEVHLNILRVQQGLATWGKQRGRSFLPRGLGLGTEMVSDERKVTLEYFWDEIFYFSFLPFFTTYLDERESAYLNQPFQS